MTAPSNATSDSDRQAHRRRRGSPYATRRSASPPESTTTEGPPERVIATPTTSSKGRFRIRLPAGPSREVRIAHWHGAHEVTERFLDLSSKAVPRLRSAPTKASTTAKRVRFEVRIPGPSQANRRIAIQARGTGKWIRIDGGRTDRGGRWSGHYRFKRTPPAPDLRLPSNNPPPTGLPLHPGPLKDPPSTVTRLARPLGLDIGELLLDPNPGIPLTHDLPQAVGAKLPLLGIHRERAVDRVRLLLDVERVHGQRARRRAPRGRPCSRRASRRRRAR